VERADGGRGFGFTSGHYHRNWGIPDFCRIVENTIQWSAGLDVPLGSAKCDITPEDLTKNLDDKPRVGRRHFGDDPV